MAGSLVSSRKMRDSRPQDSSLKALREKSLFICLDSQRFGVITLRRHKSWNGYLSNAVMIGERNTSPSRRRINKVTVQRKEPSNSRMGKVFASNGPTGRRPRKESPTRRFTADTPTTGTNILRSQKSPGSNAVAGGSPSGSLWIIQGFSLQNQKRGTHRLPLSRGPERSKAQKKVNKKFDPRFFRM